MTLLHNAYKSQVPVYDSALVQTSLLSVKRSETEAMNKKRKVNQLKSNARLYVRKYDTIIKWCLM